MGLVRPQKRGCAPKKITYFLLQISEKERTVSLIGTVDNYDLLNTLPHIAGAFISFGHGNAPAPICTKIHCFAHGQPPLFAGRRRCSGRLGGGVDLLAAQL
jgi:hypothetical protein